MTIIKRRRAAAFRRAVTVAAFAAIAVAPFAVQAQVKIGITLSATGPAASLGIPQRNSVALMPKSVAGKTIEYIVLDDASDPTTAVRNMRKLVTEDNVDAVIGSSTTPASIALVAELSSSLPETILLLEPCMSRPSWVPEKRLPTIWLLLLPLSVTAVRPMPTSRAITRPLACAPKCSCRTCRIRRMDSLSVGIPIPSIMSMSGIIDPGEY